MLIVDPHFLHHHHYHHANSNSNNNSITAVWQQPIYFVLLYWHPSGWHDAHSCLSRQQLQNEAAAVVEEMLSHDACTTRLSNEMELDVGSFWRVLLSVSIEEILPCLIHVCFTVCANPLFSSCLCHRPSWTVPAGSYDTSLQRDGIGCCFFLEGASFSL